MTATHTSPFQIGATVYRRECYRHNEAGQVVEIDGSQVRVSWPQGGALGRGARTWIRADRLTTSPVAAAAPVQSAPRKSAAEKQAERAAKQLQKPVRITVTYRPLFGNYCVTCNQGDVEHYWEVVDEPEAEVAELLERFPSAKVIRY